MIYFYGNLYGIKKTFLSIYLLILAIIIMAIVVTLPDFFTVKTLIKRD